MWKHLWYTRSLGALRAPTSSWRPFGPLDFVLRALRAFRPCDPRKVTNINTSMSMMHISVQLWCMYDVSMMLVSIMNVSVMHVSMMHVYMMHVWCIQDAWIQDAFTAKSLYYPIWLFWRGGPGRRLVHYLDLCTLGHSFKSGKRSSSSSSTESSLAAYYQLIPAQ